MSRISLLDHGYLELVDSWGSEEQIIEAARMSTDKGFRGWGPNHTPECKEQPFFQNCICPNGPKPGDEGLLKYLYVNKHATPFEMAGATFEVQAPIFVFREWHRHRTQSYNELSARYTPIPNLNYIPTIERLMVGNDGKNKQSGTVSGSKNLTVEAAERFRVALEFGYDALETGYQAALSDGVPKELARILIPVGRYSRMRATANLRNWLGFMTLRSSPNAQYEIRVYAEALGKELERHFPRTMALFNELGRGP